jgi:hypothetical protein
MAHDLSSSSIESSVLLVRDIAGAYRPAQADEVLQAHIVEYWPDSGRWKGIAVLKKSLEEVLPVAGQPGAFVAVDGGVRRHFERTGDRQWRETKGEGA